MSSPERRIDITLQRVEEEFNALPEVERVKLIDKPWVATLTLMGRLRGMEMAEEEVLGHPVAGLAETYDRLVMPGEHPIEALLRTFRATFSNAETPPRS